MTDCDRSKSLQELEHKDIGEATFHSHLVTECHRLNRVPLKDFTIEDLRIMIGQNISLNFLIPLAMEKLDQNPLAEGRFYAGDLLANALRADLGFWLKSPALASKLIEIAERALESPTITKVEFESIQEAYNLFRRALTSAK
jgi:CDI immunity proteins